MTSQTRTRNFRDTSAQAAAAAHIKAQNTTCEGCVWLQRMPRPQCKGEASDFFRMVRDTHYPRCTAYEVRRKTDPAPVKPETPPASRAAIAGEVAKKKHNRWVRA
jgi:hypothetical protein